ncbi:MAG: MFS transporter [Pseudomonadota bacterium]
MAIFLRYFAFSVIGTVMLLQLLLLPGVVGVLVDEGGLSEVAVGWLASLGAMGGAGVSLVMAMRMRHIPPRRVAAIAIGVAIVLDVLSAYTVGPSVLFFILRILSGMATTVAYVLAIAAFARFPSFERGYGLFVTLQFIVSGVGLYVLPVYSASIGADGLYLMFAASGVLALLLTPYLPQKAPSNDENVQPDNELNGSHELGVLLSIATVAAVVGFGVYEMANNAQFTYTERYGVALDLSDQAIGTTLLIASLLGIPGAFAIVVTGDRFGYVVPLGIGIGLSITGLAVLIGTQTLTGYLVGNCLMGFSWAFCLPYIQAFLASLDRNGSALAGGSTASTLGAAIGPAVAASFVGGGGYTSVFAVSIVMFVGAITLFFFSRAKVATQKKLVAT